MLGSERFRHVNRIARILVIVDELPDEKKHIY